MSQSHSLNLNRLIELTQDVEMIPNFIRDDPYGDARAAFQCLLRGDRIVSKRQADNVRAFERARGGFCPACAVHRSQGRHAQSAEAGKAEEICDLKRVIDLLPTFYVVTAQRDDGQLTLCATTWPLDDQWRGIAYQPWVTNLDAPELKFDGSDDLRALLLGLYQAGSSWRPDTKTSETEYVRREIGQALAATTVVVKEM